MHLYSWNVNGLRAAEKKGFVPWVNATQPDVLGIQEIKALPEQLPESVKAIPGYGVYFHPAERRGYSGTAVYYKKEPLSITTGLPQQRFNTEGRTITLEYKEVTILNIYFPNGQKDAQRLAFKMDFYEALSAHVQELVAQGRRVVVLGDFNTAHRPIDLKNPKANEKRSGFLPEERAWIDRFIAAGFVDTYRHLHPEGVEYSWWSYRYNARKNNAGWRIDYHFVSENLLEKVRGAAIHTEVMGSDHCPVSLELAL